MCAQYTILFQAQDLENLFGISISEDELPFPERVTPHGQAPVITPRGLQRMKFSLLPSWATEKTLKFATYNARVETLIEKPTWRKAFESQRCLIPLSTFVEPIYENEFAGNMVGFHRPTSQPLVAAGIYDQWVDAKSGEVIDSFAMITRPGLPFVKKIGHDRSPLFLSRNAFEKWLEPGKKNPQALMQFLREHLENPELIAEKDRAMKAGWEKRVDKSTTL